MVARSPAGITGLLIPPGSRRGGCGYSLVLRSANKKPRVPARLGLRPIDTQDFSLRARDSAVRERRQTPLELPVTDMAAAPGGGDAK